VKPRVVGHPEGRFNVTQNANDSGNVGAPKCNEGENGKSTVSASPLITEGLYLEFIHETIFVEIWPQL
jgi:hypothetical protein